MTYEAYGEPATMPIVAVEIGPNVERQPRKKTVGTVVAKALRDGAPRGHLARRLARNRLFRAATGIDVRIRVCGLVHQGQRCRRARLTTHLYSRPCAD